MFSIFTGTPIIMFDPTRPALNLNIRIVEQEFENFQGCLSNINVNAFFKVIFIIKQARRPNFCIQIDLH